MEIVPIVNENDEIIGHKPRAGLTFDDIYRVSALWVTSENGNILLARRSFAKKHSPGKWGPAVAGTVVEGETYDENILRETEEEIGLFGFQPTTREKYLHRGIDKWNFFVQMFTLVLPDGYDNFKVDEDEVAEVRWFTSAELEQAIAENPSDFLHGIKERIRSHLKNTI